MASIFRREPFSRYKYWYVAFTDHRGRRCKKSTGQTSRSAAQRFADAIQRAVDHAEARILTEAKAREILSELLVSIHGDSQGLRSFSVREWFDHVAAVKSKALAAPVKYQQLRNEFIEYLGRQADEPIQSVTSALVRKFRDQRASQLAAGTINNLMVVLGSFFNLAQREGLLQTNPCQSLEPIRDEVVPSQRAKKPFTVEQLLALLKAANGDWEGLIRVGLYTGARLGNCATLRVGDLDFASDPALVVFLRYSKHGDSHVVPMHPALKDHLAGLVNRSTSRRGKVIELSSKPDRPLFPTLFDRRVSYLSEDFRHLMEQAGIQDSKVREAGKGAKRSVFSLGFHSLRRTNISLLANAGVSEETRMTITAHRTRQVHQSYTSHELKKIGDAVAKLPTL